MKNLWTNICSKILLCKGHKKLNFLKNSECSLIFFKYSIFSLDTSSWGVWGGYLLAYTFFQCTLSFTLLHFSILSGPGGVFKRFRRR